MPPPVRETYPNNVVEIESSDDERDVSRVQKRSSNKPSKEPPPSQREPKVVNILKESRSFWKAGAYDIGPTKWTASQGELEHARVHPKFLHSNATSHKWAFGAIAELMDNAVDEICNGATFVKVDRIYSKRDNSPALLFQDDGGGMDPEGMRKCMSLGYSSKKTSSTIGQYGNGFKTSTMRLGADVIVFSRASRKSQTTQSVGLLSYTFLRRTGQDDVIVPMVDFDVSNHWAEPILYSSQDDWSTNLKSILEWSPFESKDDLMQQFQDIGPHGTKIIIYNLWLNDEGIYELNFDEDDEDIRLRDEGNRGNVSKLNKKVLELQSHISYRIRYSLRAYASMLYLRKFTNFNILLRGKPVEQFNIADELKYRQTVAYRPQLNTIKEVVAETTLGFIKEAPSLAVSGYNVYHKNRLIRPFWRVTNDGNSKGHGVVGVLEANFIEPAHDKQDFERSTLFSRLEMRLKNMLMEYWKRHCHLVGHQPDPSMVRKLQKESFAQPDSELAANVQNHHPTGGQVTGLSVNPQKGMHIHQPLVGLSAHTQQDLGGAQPVMHGKTGYSPVAQPSIAVATGFDQEVACVGSSRATSIDQICDENIQLFMRCEEHIQKQSELKNTIGELEKQIAETKRKCAELSSRLEIQRNQQLFPPGMSKA